MEIEAAPPELFPLLSNYPPPGGVGGGISSLYLIINESKSDALGCKLGVDEKGR